MTKEIAKVELYFDKTLEFDILQVAAQETDKTYKYRGARIHKNDIGEIQSTVLSVLSPTEFSALIWTMNTPEDIKYSKIRLFEFYKHYRNEFYKQQDESKQLTQTEIFKMEILL